MSIQVGGATQSVGRGLTRIELLVVIEIIAVDRACFPPCKRQREPDERKPDAANTRFREVEGEARVPSHLRIGPTTCLITLTSLNE